MRTPALFLPQSDDEGGRTLLLPNRCARSVWSLELVHGAAIAALLARGVEAALRPELRVVRLTIDLMRPAPMQALEARTTVVREGRRIQVMQSGLFTSRGDGETVEVARATALALRPSELPTDGAIEADAARPPDPESLPVRPAHMTGGAEAYHSTVEWRPVGEWGASPRPMLWIRNPADIVPGEPLSPLSRAVATADSLSPLANAEPSFRDGGVSFINADITLYLQREPADEWLCVVATSRQGGGGFVVCDGALHDRRGPLGRIALASLAQTQQPLGLASPAPGEGGR